MLFKAQLALIILEREKNYSNIGNEEFKDDICSLYKYSLERNTNSQNLSMFTTIALCFYVNEIASRVVEYNLVIINI